MSRILAIDWDRRELRALVLQTGATGTSVAGAWAVPLGAEGDSPAAGSAGSRLASLLSRQPLGKATTIIGVGRDHVQMKLLSLPPAPLEELPELVRFQAEREFTTLGEESSLDFLPLAGDAEASHQVLAVALSAAGMNEVRDLCRALGVEPDCVTLRACAAASCVRRAGVLLSPEVVLVISPLADEADLTVLADGHVVLMRTVRLPEVTHAAERRQALAGEIRRTLAATRHQLADRQVDRIYLSGHGAAAADEAEALADDLELPVDRFDPADHAPAGLTAAGVEPEQMGRLVGVCGMALDEANHQPPAIDFLHVRHRAAQGRFRRVHVLAAAAAVVAVIAFGAHLWRESTAPVREREAVLAELGRLQPLVAQYQDVTSRADAIQGWLATDVNWLDELQRTSEGLRPQELASTNFPAAQDVVVKTLSFFRPATGSGGRIIVDATAKSLAAVPPITDRLRDERHDVASGGEGNDPSTPGYNWSFDVTMTVTPPPDAAEEDAAP